MKGVCMQRGPGGSGVLMSRKLTVACVSKRAGNGVLLAKSAAMSMLQLSADVAARISSLLFSRIMKSRHLCCDVSIIDSCIQPPNTSLRCFHESSTLLLTFGEATFVHPGLNPSPSEDRLLRKKVSYLAVQYTGILKQIEKQKFVKLQL